MTPIVRKYLIALILTFSVLEINAQVCTGTLGDPVINIDFGRGTSNIGPPIAETNYFYIAGNPNDGQYTVVQSSAGLNPGWHQNIVNHTPNDPTGYMMLVNADFNKGIFYQTTINNLCPNTTYEFAAWVINILRGTGIKPNVKFTIENNGSLVQEFSTRDIIEGSATNWIKYGTIFTTPANVGNITLKITNENPGGNGNDLALDDITFRPCGPKITPSISETNSTTANLCEGITKNYDLKVQVSAGFSDPHYQWQTFINGQWINIANETNLNTTVAFNNAAAGIYKYRVAVAEGQNINAVNCKIFSDEITFKINSIPNPVATNNGPSCFGGDIQLFTNNVEIGDPSDIITYNWVGPNFFSNAKDPHIINMNFLNAGTYTLTVTKNGCSKSVTTEVVVLPRLVLSTNITDAKICEGESVQLEVNGNEDPANQYIWTPSAGLSNDKIANPIATPTITTTYNVKVGRGNCFSDATITIQVLGKTSANAGVDKRILQGQNTTLDGKISGNTTSYSWSPTTYLDDPTKLDPIANPPFDIKYKLTAVSDCNVSEDEVMVKVYKNIEIPNAFSPNGDGINDGWIISSIENFDNIKLKVVNRLGQIVFETTDTTKPWNGKLNGKDLPVGVYYYTLYLNQDFKTYTGWVLLTR